MKNMFRRKDHISSLCERHLSLPAGLVLTVWTKIQIIFFMQIEFCSFTSMQLFFAADRERPWACN